MTIVTDNKTKASIEAITDIVTADGNALMDMARLVLGLRMLLARNQNAQSPYPVLGAIGGDFFLEISSGTLRDRRILTTIYVTLGKEFALASP